MTHEEKHAALIEAARQVAQNAYSPYSHVRVGSAVLTADGDLVAGCNVENISFGMTICAERNAVFQAVARRGRVRLETVVVYTPAESPLSPCGGCLQVIQEFGPEAEIVCVCDGPDVLRGRLADFLPPLLRHEIIASRVNSVP